MPISFAATPLNAAFHAIFFAVVAIAADYATCCAFAMLAACYLFADAATRYATLLRC